MERGDVDLGDDDDAAATAAFVCCCARDAAIAFATAGVCSRLLLKPFPDGFRAGEFTGATEKENKK